MSTSIENSYKALVALLHNDIDKMCADVLMEDKRDLKKCVECFRKLKDHENFLANMFTDLILPVRACHNALNPIVHLPEAVLYLIMMEVASDMPPQNRLFLGQICSHWRKRALDIRELWSAIDLQWRELSREYLQRSLPIPINVKFESSNYYDVEDADYQEHLKILSPHVLRLRSLALQIPRHLLSTSLKILCNAASPHLEVLIIKTDDYDSAFEVVNNGPAASDIAGLFNESTPRLRQLSLKNLTISCDSTLIKNLNILRLENCTISGLQFDFFHVLQACPNLRALHLSRVKPLMFRVSANPPLEEEILHFPNLGHLNLQRLDAPDLQKLLWRISIPQTTQLSISCCLDDIYAFHDILPPLPHNLKNISNIRSLSISMGHRTILRGAMYAQGGPTLLQLDLGSVDPSRNAEQLLQSVMQSIPFHNLTRLSISCKHCFRDIPKDLACNVLRSVPTIKHLSVFGIYGQDVLHCLGLSSAGAICTLECTDISFCEADTTAWLNTNSPVHLPLTLLEFSSCTGITDKHISKLREMIPEVSWDEEGREFAWPKSAVPSSETKWT